ARAADASRLVRWPAGAESVVDVDGVEADEAEAIFRAFDAWLADARASLRVRPGLPGEPCTVVFREVTRVDAGHESPGRTSVE
ncbi:MAG: hypothetical protein GWN71_37295, partial [Gammaproteobacteria bacterium]|nr:hypothetical protein [Gemmatimonadota bacterium]NIU79007.1 hypothetical protein [Gammaproteobacteria bacterium]